MFTDEEGFSDKGRGACYVYFKVVYLKFESSERGKIVKYHSKRSSCCVIIYYEIGDR